MGSSFGQDISRNSGCSSSELSCDSPGFISVVLTGTNELFELEPTIFEALKKIGENIPEFIAVDHHSAHFLDIKKMYEIVKANEV